MQKINRIRIAEKFGWTLDYVDSLDDFTIAEIAGVMDGDNKVAADRQRLASAKRGRR